MRKFICYTISSIRSFLMIRMMMVRWALVSSWLKMMMTLRLMDLKDVPPEEEEDEELEPASDEDEGEIFNTNLEDDA
jgi:hypothetical protein